MRLISQNKEIDIPYEMSMLKIEAAIENETGKRRWYVVAYISGIIGSIGHSNYTVYMGRYSTKERAIKAANGPLIRLIQDKDSTVYQFPDDIEVDFNV